MAHGSVESSPPPGERQRGAARTPRRLRPPRRRREPVRPTRPAQVWPAKAGRRFTGRAHARPGRRCTARGWIGRCTRWTSRAGAVKWSIRLTGHHRRRCARLGRHRLRGEHPARRAGQRARPQHRAAHLARQRRLRCPRRSPWSIGCSWWRTSGASSSASIPKTGARHWRRQTGRRPFIAPMPAGRRDVVLATPDSLFRIATGDGSRPAASARARTVVSPWISNARTRSWPARRIRWSLAIDPDSLTHALEGPAGRPGAWTVPAVVGRYAVRGDPPGHALPGRPRHAAPGRSGSWSSTGRSRRRSPSSTASSCWAAPTGRIRALDPDGNGARGGSQLWRPIELGPLPLDDGMVAVGGDGDLHRFRR